MKASRNGSSLDALDIFYRSSEHLVVFRWHCSLPGDEGLGLSYEALLAFALQHQCPHWLLDLRRHPAGPAGQHLAEFKAFCARAKAAFPAAEAIHASYLVAPSALPCYARLFANALPHTTGQGYHAAAFVEEGPANAWLLGRKPTQGNGC